MGVAAILKLQSAGFTMEQVTALADLVNLQAASKTDLQAVERERRIDSVSAEPLATERRLDRKIMEAQVSIQRFILTTILSALGINPIMILGAMFGLAKLLGH